MEAAEVKAEDFLNRSKKSAQDFAENKNLIFRLIRIDNEAFFPYPDPSDIRTDRVCVEIENGKVKVAVLQ